MRKSRPAQSETRCAGGLCPLAIPDRVDAHSKRRFGKAPATWSAFPAGGTEELR